MKFEQINDNLKELEKKYSINQMDNCIEITTSAIDVDGNNMKLYITVENDKIRISDNSYLLNVVFPKHKQNADEGVSKKNSLYDNPIYIEIMKKRGLKNE